ncbi:MAG: carbamoyltransferase HypF [Candidatus Methanodesulfokora sp.]|nr:MAG: carbamoyltransferase HypF [Candidatus Korarchaeota archaeon]
MPKTIRITGIVQGVGFRPFIHRLATELGLNGYVRNLGGSEVEIYVEEDDIDSFLDLIVKRKPSPARIDEITVIQSSSIGIKGFHIMESGREMKSPSMIPPDIGICEDCLKEVLNKEDKRYGYAFNSCAWCGPRYSMMFTVPYDRDNTAMRDFPLCNDCSSEYNDPNNLRRFHAEGISCPKCGPILWIEDNQGRIIADSPIDTAAELINSGRIVAVKGIGGYHIAALATDDEVVSELRRRKNRPQKPFALMALNLEVASSIVDVEGVEKALTGPERPIILLRKKRSNVSDLVAPGLNYLGVMLPYSALHYLLLEKTRDKFLIMTSGNLRDLPMCRDEDSARRELGGVVDYFLHHNRRIVNRVDDSVLRITNGRVTMIRRGRGYAPMWFELPSKLERPVVALGAELQNAGAIAFDDKVVMTQFIGDTDVYENLIELDRAIKFLAGAYKVELRDAVCAVDMHPGYKSRIISAEFKDVFEVQHHHAHLLSVAGERKLKKDRIVGIAVDGIGYGADGMYWGGEVLLIEGGDVRRIGGLKYQPMPGGDLATLYPVRMLIGIMSTFMADDKIYSFVERRGLYKHLPNGIKEVELVLRQARRSIRTSSLGRLLDSVSALLGICYERTYEGEPAIKLESFAEGGRLVDDIEISGNDVLDTSLLMEKLIEHDARREDLAYTVIYQLGRGLARIALKEENEVVFLSGGASVNSILVRGIEDELLKEKVRLIMNERVPAGDGGIALGQVMAVLRHG